jgi:hypothetical protein
LKTMTNNNHPITPPDDLQEQWKQEWLRVRPAMTPFIQWMLAKSARWGADQELEACCEYLTRCAAWEPEDVQEFCDHRRPKPPSLKAQALEALKHSEEGWRPVPADCEIIRRALESLSD